jgi:hypothetical protein
VGDPYERVIREAIGKAKIFIPILSPAIAAELEENGKSIDTFYSHEWRWAAENTQLAVFPIAICGYDLRRSLHQTFIELVGHAATTGIDMTEKPLSAQTSEMVGYAKLLSSIKKHLGLEES